MEGDDYHFKFKIVILGDKAVGKTSFLDCNIISTQQLVNLLERLSIQSIHNKWPSSQSLLLKKKQFTV